MANGASHDIDVRDLEYLRHGDRPLLARLFVPRGEGPFPMVVELHGGAWCRGDRTSDTILNEPLARSGVVVAALDFRQPPEAAYPGSLQDISYAVRWFKSRAGELRGRADRVGLMGTSSGAHQAMLLAMKPRDPKHAALPLPAGAPPVDGSVRCAVLCWPVIDPLGRYRYARELKASGDPYPEVVDRVLPSHDLYWGSEAAMAEGNPTMALERGEAVETPPALYIQGTEDKAHPRPHLERFVREYRKIGGSVDLELMEGESEGYITRKPASPAVGRTIARIVEFVGKHLG
ncbi:MAG TPA: alpha/beta hydrolase [Methylomirabilota bacterium]|nr:alpha/beta hydrolase [Methylomirabilota bacterium]